jgi:hypothetical protein
MLTSLHRFQRVKGKMRKGLHAHSILSYQLTSPINREDFWEFAAGIPWPDRIYLSTSFCAPCYLLIVMVYDGIYI